MCQIWAYYHKLFNECGHIIARLAWKPWIFVHGRSFFRTLFQENVGIPSLIFLLVGRPRLMMWRGGLPFFWFFYGVFKNRAISSWLSSVARGWIMQSCCQFFDGMPTYGAKNDFYKKYQASYGGPAVQIPAGSSWIGRRLSEWPGVATRVGNAWFLTIIRKIGSALR